ncbi:competence type IV pilus assembly protein ComGB [Bacillus sp. FJAT-50079]|uniref:competence type IV pilus assembly protein ComGB n=1 Tax=Bacillus sp. FJAT-50079 TaxID=2833577 RepID=UPI001BC8EF29|nr:competence type IV pilus assembly protein ComGB [Bacillus sp. FJAT-50079]MBS4209608.1 type II secretion system F family protein [Bacillus sp. FJAT-50079]
MDLFRIKNIVAGTLKGRLPLHIQGEILLKTGNMLNNGFTLQQALDFQGRMYRKHQMFFSSMIDQLQTGQPFHHVMLGHDFDRKACTQVYFADKHGFLAESLEEAGQYLIRRDTERKKLVQLLYYPLLLFFVLLIVGLLMQLFLLPRFQLFYQTMGYEPNTGLKLLLHLTTYLPIYSFIFIILSVGFAVTAVIIIRKYSALEIASLYSRLPFIKSFYKLYQTIFLSREWSFLLKSGFSMNEIMHIMEEQNLRPLMRETAEYVKRLLLVGYSTSEALAHLHFLEDEMALIVAHGEQNSRLDRELLYYSQICLQRFEEMTMKLFQVIQPTIFAVIGFVVIIMYMSIFLPMFRMIESM